MSFKKYFIQATTKNIRKWFWVYVWVIGWFGPYIIAYLMKSTTITGFVAIWGVVYPVVTPLFFDMYYNYLLWKGEYTYQIEEDP